MIVAIELGNINSHMAIWENNESKLIPNAEGQFLTSSIINIDAKGNVKVGGLDSSDPPSQITFTNFVSYMGTLKLLQRGDQSFYPEELCALLIKSLVRDAEKHLNTKITKAIITVPDTYNGFQLKAYRTAGELAGIEVQFINEASTNVCPFTVGTHIEVSGSLLFCPIIRRNSPIFTSHEIEIPTTRDNQVHIEIGIYQNESNNLDDSVKIGDLMIIVSPRPAGEEVVKLSLTYDFNDMLNIETTVISTSKQRTLAIDLQSFHLSEDQFCNSLVKLQKYLKI